MTKSERESAPTVFGKKMKRVENQYSGNVYWRLNVAGLEVEVWKFGSFITYVQGESLRFIRASTQAAANDAQRHLLRLRDSLCRATGTAAVDAFMPDFDVEDSERLSQLRAAIDDAGLFPSEAASERGDYVAAVRSAGRRLKKARSK